MLESFAPLLRKIIPAIGGVSIFITIAYMIFALIDADKEERLGIVIKSILALVIMIALEFVAVIFFSFLALIGFIIVAIYLFSSNG